MVFCHESQRAQWPEMDGSDTYSKQLAYKGFRDKMTEHLSPVARPRKRLIRIPVWAAEHAPGRRVHTPFGAAPGKDEGHTRGSSNSF